MNCTLAEGSPPSRTDDALLLRIVVLVIPAQLATRIGVEIGILLVTTAEWVDRLGRGHATKIPPSRAAPDLFGILVRRARGRDRLALPGRL